MGAAGTGGGAAVGDHVLKGTLAACAGGQLAAADVFPHPAVEVAGLTYVEEGAGLASDPVFAGDGRRTAALIGLRAVLEGTAGTICGHKTLAFYRAGRCLVAERNQRGSTAASAVVLLLETGETVQDHLHAVDGAPGNAHIVLVEDASVTGEVVLLEAQAVPAGNGGPEHPAVQDRHGDVWQGELGPEEAPLGAGAGEKRENVSVKHNDLTFCREARRHRMDLFADKTQYTEAAAKL